MSKDKEVKVNITREKQAEPQQPTTPDYPESVKREQELQRQKTVESLAAQEEGRQRMAAETKAREAAEASAAKAKQSAANIK